MQIKHYFHPDTFTLSYLVYDENSKDAVLIDSVIDYDPKASMIKFTSANLMVRDIEKMGLNLAYLLETHAHADHLSGIGFLKEVFPNAKTAISEKIKDVQGVFGDVFQLDKANDGSEFDILLEDNQVLTVGDLSITAIATPGHTPACMTFVINDEAAFTGDLLFNPDYGTGRCDFPAGSSEQMFESIKRLYQLNDNIEVYPGHDYMPGGRIVQTNASLREHKDSNVQITANTKKEDFVAFRDKRDAGLAAPTLLLQSVQFNAWGADEINAESPKLTIPLRIKRD